MATGTQPPPDDLLLTVAAILRERMEKVDMSVAELARKVDIPRPTVSKIVNAKRHPQITVLRRISLALGIPFPALFEEVERKIAASQSDSPLTTGSLQG